jgi:hypothetical protein
MTKLRLKLRSENPHKPDYVLWHRFVAARRRRRRCRRLKIPFAPVQGKRYRRNQLRVFGDIMASCLARSGSSSGAAFLGAPLGRYRSRR